MNPVNMEFVFRSLVINRMGSLREPLSNAEKKRYHYTQGRQDDPLGRMERQTQLP
jgi:hypothetical protein